MVGKKKGGAIAAAVAFLLMGCAQQPQRLPQGEWVDLTHVLSSESVFWPTSEKFRLSTVYEGRTEHGYYYSAYQFCTAEHGGTHIDAPVHFAEGRKSVDQLALDQLIGPAVVVDVSERAVADADYRVGIADFEAWEQRHGVIGEGSIVLLHTGYAKRWPDAERYLGTALRGEEGVANLHFPGLHPEAAQWLLRERRIRAVGLDTASIDYGQSKLYETHVTLMEQNVPAFENLTNLDRLPPTGALVIALPIKIGGGSGGPLRAIALIPQ